MPTDEYEKDNEPLPRFEQNLARADRETNKPTER